MGGVSITYMGTKRALAPAVSEVIGQAQPGVLLDAFSGMCAVGGAVGERRQIWNNDVQIFAAQVARSLFKSRDLPLSPVACADVHFATFRAQCERLTQFFPSSLAAESDLLEATSFSRFNAKTATLRHALAKEIAKCQLRSPHLFTRTYAGTFFGIRQAIEADSVVAAIRVARKDEVSSSDEHRWCVVALGRALLKIANSPGHFAQFLKPKANNYRRYLALRRRSVWAEWLSSVALMSPIGAPQWRKKNKVFNRDCLELIQRLARNDIGVIYADPPYTDDQYSRFYHLLETLCLYDYPNVTGAGLYRPDRFQTPFSLKSEAPAAFQKLIASASRTGADLVLSYPTNGLVCRAGINICSMLRKSFKRVEICESVAHTHSTFGASKGAAHAATTELIYLARSA